MKPVLMGAALLLLAAGTARAATAAGDQQFCDGKGNCMTESEYQAYLAAPDYHCTYYANYIWKESERPYGKQQYAYSEDSLRRIKALKDEGIALCEAGKFAEGEDRLKRAIKIISFTPPAK